MRILFQGDSITDCGRDRDNPRDLGGGYPKFVAKAILEAEPDTEWDFLNFGVSGDRAKDLLARWETDCLQWKPDIVSILVGINDTWRAFDSNDATTVEAFEEDYRALLTALRETTQAKILLLEPFVLEDEPSKQTWRTDLDPKIHVVRRLARAYADAFVPLDGLFASASVDQQPDYWAEDGVHPTEHGAELISFYYTRALWRII